MGWKTKAYDYKWNHNKIDKVEVKRLLSVIRDGCSGYMPEMAKPYVKVIYFTHQMQRDLEVGSILVDLTYGNIFDWVQDLKDDPDYDSMVSALGELYVAADIGTLAADHIERERRERAWMIKKGFTNG